MKLRGVFERLTVMENEISELVAKFCGVTAANPEQAKFYLESTEWQIEPALQLFFRGGYRGTANRRRRGWCRADSNEFGGL